MSDPRPLVSIITPTYNQAAYLEETIQSVLRQDYPRIEFIVIDGGSTDGNVEILKRHHDRLAYWVSERDEGQSHALNKGFARATGEIIAWINGDDVYFSPTVISEVVRAFAAHPSAGIVYGDTALITRSGVIYRFLPSMRRISMSRLQYYCPSQSATFMRADVVRAHPIRQDLHTRMDYEYWVRLCRDGVAFQYVPSVWSAFRVHPQSKTAATGTGLDEELFAIKRDYFNGAWLARGPLEAVARRSAAAWLRLRGAGRARELYGVPLAFAGQRLPRWRFYRHQLLSTTFSVT